MGNILQNKKFLFLLKFSLYFLCFFILSKANIYGFIYPFFFGLFFALIWCGEKIYFLTPIYLVANLINNFSYINIISCISMVVLTVLFLAIHTKLKKQITFPIFCLIAIISQAGYVFSNIYFLGDYTTPILTLFVGIVFLLACKEILQVVLIRGLVYKLNISETICAFIVLSAFASGLCSFNIFGLEIIKIFACFLIIISSFVFSSSLSILIASTIGLSTLLTTGSTNLIAPFVIWGLVVSIFKTKNRFFPVLAVLLVDFVLGFYANIYPTYTMMSFLAPVVACLFYISIPAQTMEKLLQFFNFSSNDLAMRNVVNRSRENLCKRLYDLSYVFNEMDYVFRSMVKGSMSKSQVKAFLLAEIKDKACQDCKEKNLCHRMCQEDTNTVFDNLISSALERGKTTLLDIPPYLTTRCNRISNLVGTINQLCSQYKQYTNVMNNMDSSRVLIAEQLSGVSKIMKNLASEVNNNISFDSTREIDIINELSYNNIICSDAVIYEENTNVVSATIVVRKKDSTKIKIPEIVSKICKTKMSIYRDDSSVKAGWNVLSLKTAPKYNIVFGTANCIKDNSTISGDCFSIIRIEGDKYLLALSDGMGSGEKAEKTSSLAIGLVENFYKAGFDNDIILSSINKLLSLNKEEIFSALDVCVIDTRLGTADFVKMGAPNSYIKHNNDQITESINGGALPLGIIQDIEPNINKKILTNGDFIFLFTDGISESFESEELLQDYINNLRGLNPQTLADDIIKECLSKTNNIALDDMTIIVAKIYSTD